MSKVKIKYTIHGFQQNKLIENGLSNDDALVLKVIKDMYSSANIEYIIHNNDKYMWISYSAVINYIPIIGSKSNLMSKIKRFEELELIDRVLKKSKDGVKGNYAYIKILKNLDLLTEYENDGKNLVEILDNPYLKSRQPLSKNKTTLIQNLDNKDSINKDTINKDNNIGDLESQNKIESELQEQKPEDIFFEEVWQLYPNKKGKTQAKSHKINIYKHKDKIKLAIERYIKDTELRRKDFPALEYKYGSTFFTSAFYEYIDDNFEFYISKEQKKNNTKLSLSQKLQLPKININIPVGMTKQQYMESEEFERLYGEKYRELLRIKEHNKKIDEMQQII